MVTNSDVEHSTRYAGLIQRYHMWPVLRRQTVAEHTWHLMRIYRELFGTPPVNVWEYILYHDVDEMGTGDVPYQVKRSNPQLADLLREAGERWMDRVGLPHTLLAEAQREKVKLADLIEMAEYGVDEYMSGNRLAWPIVLSTFEDVCRRTRQSTKLSADEQDAVFRHLNRLRNFLLSADQPVGGILDGGPRGP